MKNLVFFILLNLVFEPVFAELELNGLPVESAQSLQQNLKTIQTYFNDIKRVAKNINQSDKKQSLTELTSKNKLSVFGESSLEYGDDNRGDYRPRAPRHRISRRDPFAITSRMFEGDPSLQDLGLDFQPDTDLKIPTLKLKGVVNGVDGKIAALVDVEDVGVIVVREGDTIGLRSKDGGGLRVRKISRTGLILTAGSLGRDVIVK